MSNTISFDESFYLSQNPDVAAAVSRGVFASGAQHYQLNGRFEGRNPNAFFNTSFYLGTYTDVARAGVNPLTHFLTSGAAEGRLANSNEKGVLDLNGNGGADEFNETAYRAAYSDVDNAIKAGTLKNGYQHFILYGQFENRVATLSNGATITGPLANTGTPGTPGTPSASLTTQRDVIVGTAGNDFINAERAIVGGTVFDTLNNSDTIDGGAGNDTLSVQLTTGGTTTPSSIKNVETLQVEVLSNAGTTAIDFSNGDAALKTINIANSVGAFTANNLQGKIDTLSISNTSTSTTLNVAAANLTGTTDAIAVNLSNASGGTVTIAPSAAGNGYETFNVTSSGSVANTVTLTDGIGTTLSTVNVAGSQRLNLTLSDTSVTTVNAASATGILNLTVAAGSGNQTITGGSANDIINLNGTYTNQDVINGGLGVDTLVLTNAEATAATAVQTNVTGIESLQLSNGLAGTVTLANFGATSLALTANATGAGVVNYAAGTGTLDLGSATGNTSLTVNVAGTATTDVLNVNVGNATAGTGNTFGAVPVVINGAETVNLLSQGGANTFGGAFTLTNTAATETLKITGSQSLTFTGAVRADVIDASGMTGNATLTLTGGTGTTATAITGTGNADVLNGSTAADIINGGAGADTIANVITGNAATAGDVITTGAGFDTVILRGDATSAALPGLYNNAANVTDFTVGTTATTTDILALSATNTNYGNAATGFHTGIAAAAAGATTVQTVAQNAAATAAVTGLDLIKLSTGVATGALDLQGAFNAAIGSASVTTLSGAGVEVFFSMYDTTNNRAVIGVVDSGANATVETGDVVSIVGTINMSAADYANFSANNLSIVTA